MELIDILIITFIFIILILIFLYNCILDNNIIELFNTIDNNYSFILKYNPIYYLVDGFRSSFYFDKQINLYSNIYILMIIFLIISSSLYIFNKGFRVIK